MSSLRPIEWPFKKSKEQVSEVISQLAKEIQLKWRDRRLTIKWSVYGTSKKPIFLSFPGADDYFASNGENPTFLATIESGEGSMIGFFALSLLKAKEGGEEAVIEYIVSPNGNGAAESILLFLKGAFSKLLDVKRLYAEIEWAGREYWAQPQFEFHLSPLQPKVVLDGEQVSFSRIMKSNFINFIRRHSIREEDLCIFKSSGCDDFDLSKIDSPGVLRLVQCKDGSRVSVDALKSFDQLQKRLLHVGSAFLLSDYHPHPKQASQLRIGEKTYSDAAMPPWFGVIDRSCEDFLARKIDDLRAPREIVPK